jgi:FixJ family two-component response regulator
MTSQTHTVFVVDDALEVRVALSRLLASGGYSVRLFESAERYLGDEDAETPGCLLLDMSMPGLSGLELQRTLAGSRFGRPIIFLTGQGDVQSSVHAMKAGAVDFLTKPIDEIRLFSAVDQALRRDGEERRKRAIHRMIEQRLEALTPRERQVMEQVVFGRLNKQIAADLGTGEKTVKVHRARVMWKMGARSVAELVQLAARVGVALDPALRMSVRLPPIHANAKAPDPLLPAAIWDAPCGSQTDDCSIGIF